MPTTKVVKKDCSGTYHLDTKPLRIAGVTYLARLKTAVAAALRAPRVPLFLFRSQPAPAVYMLFLKTSKKNLVDMYGSEICSGKFVQYIGVAQDVRDRLKTHIKTIASAQGLDVSDFYVSVIYTISYEQGQEVETMLIREFQPAWNERALSGFGSKPQGGGRVSCQIPSGFDCLHRRDWVTKAPAKSRVTQVLKALSIYRVSGSVRDLWKAL